MDLAVRHKLNIPVTITTLSFVRLMKLLIITNFYMNMHRYMRDLFYYV